MTTSDTDTDTSESPLTALQQYPDQSPKTEAAALNREPKTDRPWLWQKGQSGNPKGRPTNEERRRSFIEVLRNKVEEAPEPLADAAYRKGTKGDVRALTFIRDTLYGTPERTVRVIDQGGPLAGLLAGIAGQIIDAEVRELPDGEPPITT